jgi:cytochrome c oxidase subunit 2
MKSILLMALLCLTLAVIGINRVLADIGDEEEQIIKIDASRFSFRPDGITLKKGVPVILEFTSKDTLMGFNAPGLKARADIIPGMVTRVRIVPDKVGVIRFFCDIFCGSGHEDMTGTITVVD